MTPLTVNADPAVLARLQEDPQMAVLIDRFGPYRWPLSPPFVALVRAVVGQLISGAAARATFNRLEAATAIDPSVDGLAPQGAYVAFLTRYLS